MTVRLEIKKMVRDDGGVLSDERRAALSKELGDVLWYVAQLATEAGLELEEIAQANLDKLASRQRRAVLHEIGADDVPVELVLNKIDRVDPLGRRRLGNRFPGALQISAATGEGVDGLRARIADRFSDRFEDVRLLLPYEEGGKLAELYALGAPIEEREDLEEGVLVRAKLPGREVRRFAKYLVADSTAAPAVER